MQGLLLTRGSSIKELSPLPLPHTCVRWRQHHSYPRGDASAYLRGSEEVCSFRLPVEVVSGKFKRSASSGDQTTRSHQTWGKTPETMYSSLLLLLVPTRLRPAQDKRHACTLPPDRLLEHLAWHVPSDLGTLLQKVARKPALDWKGVFAGLEVALGNECGPSFGHVALVKQAVVERLEGARHSAVRSRGQLACHWRLCPRLAS
mmetsp:Transcript_35206/g.101116  ORF Transcript_35206/g.101116 Transcript_35206/m.101116 type:complete len:203 (+) Transcript_35206:259-867(+)